MNDYPKTFSAGEAFWNRNRIVHLPNLFVEASKLSAKTSEWELNGSIEGLEPQLKDIELYSKMAKEKSGIFNILLEYLKKYKSHGLSTPASILMNTEEQQKAFRSNPQTFIEDCLVIDKSGKNWLVSDCFNGVYKAWCSVQNKSDTRGKLKPFAQSLAETPGFEMKHTKKGNFYNILIRKSELSQLSVQGISTLFNDSVPKRLIYDDSKDFEDLDDLDDNIENSFNEGAEAKTPEPKEPESITELIEQEKQEALEAKMRAEEVVLYIKLHLAEQVDIKTEAQARLDELEEIEKLEEEEPEGIMELIEEMKKNQRAIKLHAAQQEGIKSISHWTPPRTPSPGRGN